ncbi:MAG TPA: plastocyanin/azurin family copper-binding protein [Ktedonosporobacter sp.]|nr:plastocyanin/azurin family copper-binding protein [Ktedonosporobacter sp.]
MYKKLLFGMIALALLTVLFTACTIKDTANAPAGPVVKMGSSNFLQPTITIKKGEAVTLVNTAAVPHIVVNGTWDGAVQKPAQEAGAPKVSMNFNGQGSQSTPPFNTAGTFKIYCTIHGGMNLTVTVQ